MPEPVHRISVGLPDRAYDVSIAPGLLARLGSAVQRVAPHARALLAVDSNILTTHGETARRSLEEAGIKPIVRAIEASEKAKTLETVRGLYDCMLAAHLERESPVIALGGGIVGDVAGFAAATYLRGVPLVHVPTTLLAMVDAAIGGKCGVNYPLPGAAGTGTGAAGILGKNMIGAFWQPRAVLADPLVLGSLDDRQLRCGLAECVKHGLIADAALVHLIEEETARILARDLDVLTHLVAHSARLKVSIVMRDERESGVRALLNLGHTFAHAIEPIQSLRLLHGEAVAIGLCAAVRCSALMRRAGSWHVEQVERVLRRLGLPTALPAPLPVSRLMQIMRFDKKASGDRLRLILPLGIGTAEICDDVPAATIEAAWLEVGAAPG